MCKDRLYDDNTDDSIVEIIEGLGWSIIEINENKYELRKPSPAGQDFGFIVEGEDVDDLLDCINIEYVNFDVSRETYKWLDSEGHGTNGAPYDMRDLYNDMEACRDMILELYEKLL